jgi:hypothetical protein
MVGVELVWAPAAGAVITGVAGGVLSTVKDTGAEAGLVPAPVVAVAVTGCWPSASGVLGMQLKCPLASALATQAVTPSTFTVTVLFGVAVPASAGVVSLVDEPSAGAVMTGAGGSWLAPTVKGVGLEAGPALPAASVAAALTLCAPGVNGVADAQLKTPAAFAVLVHTGVEPPSTKTLTVLPGSAVPA